MKSPTPDNQPPPIHDSGPWSVRLLQTSAIALLGFLAYLLFRPIMPALLWGGLLAVISAHGYERLVSRLGGRRGLGVLIFGIFYTLVLVVPLLFFVLEAIAHAPVLTGLSDQLTAGALIDEIEKAEQATAIKTGLPDWLRTFRDHLDERMAQVVPHLGSAATWLAGRVGDLGGFFFEFLLGCVTALVLLYNRFVVRAAIARLLAKIGGGFAQDLMDQTFETTRGAFRGVVAAATAQTILAAMALVVAGVPGVVLLSTLTFMLALVQIGPLVTAIIAGGILFMEGAVLAAVLTMVWFLVIVMSVDNLIRPYFASRANDTPAFLTFLGALGGLLAFGLIGVFIGPVLIALLYRLLVTWLNQEPMADKS
jgi:predicted PurR-regulated permease PerM